MVNIFRTLSDQDIARTYSNYQLAEMYYTLKGDYTGLKKYSRIAMVQQLRDLLTAVQSEQPQHVVNRTQPVNQPYQQPQVNQPQTKPATPLSFFSTEQVEEVLIKYDAAYDSNKAHLYSLKITPSTKNRISIRLVTGETKDTAFTQVFKDFFEEAVRTQMPFDTVVSTMKHKLNTLLKASNN